MSVPQKANAAVPRPPDGPVGRQRFHRQPFFDYQLNRIYGEGFTAREELLDAASKIRTTEDYVEQLVRLSGEAEAGGRLAAAAFYLRGAEFFVAPTSPQRRQSYERVVDLFARAFAASGGGSGGTGGGSGGTGGGSGGAAPGLGDQAWLISRIGIEMGLGQYLGDITQSKILLFKSDRGGSSLREDWRSPTMVEKRGSEVGADYENTMAEFREFVQALAPADYGATHVRVSGFIWLQGWETRRSNRSPPRKEGVRGASRRR